MNYNKRFKKYLSKDVNKVKRFDLDVQTQSDMEFYDELVLLYAKKLNLNLTSLTGNTFVCENLKITNEKDIKRLEFCLNRLINKKFEIRYLKVEPNTTYVRFNEKIEL